MAALTLALLLAGCTGRSEPADPPATTSAAPSPSPTPSFTPVATPVRPDAMGTASVEGAIAAATYFMEVYTYARQTGDLTEWNALSADDCGFCTAVSASVEKANAAGHTVRGAEIDILESTGSEVTPEVFSASLRVVEAASDEIDASDTVVASGAGGRHDLLFAFTWANRWIVEAIDVSATPTASS